MIPEQCNVVSTSIRHENHAETMFCAQIGIRKAVFYSARLIDDKYVIKKKIIFFCGIWVIYFVYALKNSKGITCLFV